MRLTDSTTAATPGRPRPRRRPRPQRLVGALVALLCVATIGSLGAGSSSAAAAVASRAAAPESSVSVGWALVKSGYTQPVQVTSAHDGSGRFFIVTKTGRVWVYENGATLPTPYLDLTSLVSTDGERGLLSIAFPPWFTTSPQVFVAYTALNGTLVVRRYTATSSAANSITTPGALLLQVAHPTYSNHNAGQLAFGPDKLLYIGTGDGGGAGDPFNNSQNLKVLNGKILRIDPAHACGALMYCIPPGNQFATSNVDKREIWLSGLRNPWRFSVDPSTGFVYIGDVGQDRYEEIDVVASGYRWLNMGWSCLEGRATYIGSRCIAGQPYRSPLVVISHPTAEAIIGGFVYRGSLYPSMTGLYVFGDYITGRIWVYRYTGAAVLQSVRLDQVSSFGVSDTGEIYATTLSGGFYRMRVSAR
ncbi:MAG: PQQ-dependent sugar dehydrogenase [Actinomycetes bacterium]